jgi:hypothetical protein
MMNEKIGTTLIGGDESETLFGVEPLDGALSHDFSCFLRPGYECDVPSRRGSNAFFYPYNRRAIASVGPFCPLYSKI